MTNFLSTCPCHSGQTSHHASDLYDFSHPLECTCHLRITKWKWLKHNWNQAEPTGIPGRRENLAFFPPVALLLENCWWAFSEPVLCNFTWNFDSSQISSPKRTEKKLRSLPLPLVFRNHWLDDVRVRGGRWLQGKWFFRSQQCSYMEKLHNCDGMHKIGASSCRTTSQRIRRGGLEVPPLDEKLLAIDNCCNMELVFFMGVCCL